MNKSNLSKPDTPTEISSVSDKALQQFMGYHLKRAFNVIRSDLSQTLEPLGLRMITYSALVLITDNPGVRQSQLATSLDIERPNLVVVIDELEQRELIVRERVPTDRRANALQATLAGQRLCQKAIEADLTHEAELLSGISEEERKIVIKAMRIIGRTGKDTVV